MKTQCWCEETDVVASEREDSPREASALPYVVEHQGDVSARSGGPGLKREKIQV